MKLNSLALTGTLSTMPSEISFGYVMAMPKFTSMLNAVEEENDEQLYISKDSYSNCCTLHK